MEATISRAVQGLWWDYMGFLHPGMEKLKLPKYQAGLRRILGLSTPYLGAVALENVAANLSSK